MERKWTIAGWAIAYLLIGTVSGCSDNRPSSSCQRYKANGYCDPNSAYFSIAKMACAKTCKTCVCHDVQPLKFCQSWKHSGLCAKTAVWYQYMSENCAATCEVCKTVAPSTPAPTTTPPTTVSQSCHDDISYCATYKPYCNDNDYVKFLQKSCKKTCNYCHITTVAPTTTKPVPTTPYIVKGGSEKHQPGCGIKGPGLSRIVGGTNAAPGEWPWQVTFDTKHNAMHPGHHCGGTIINERWILSAAHCFDQDNDTNSYWLALGEHDLKTSDAQNEQRISIEKILLHPKYIAATHDYDLALIKLTKPMIVNKRARAACLPDHKTSFATGAKCFITGWGLVKEFGNRHQILQQASVPLVDRHTCQKGYNQFNYQVTPRMLCAGHSQGGIDSCEGDSGGPLVCRAPSGLWYLWGVISWGVGCARQGLYGVYADTKLLRPWIDSVVFPAASAGGLS